MMVAGGTDTQFGANRNGAELRSLVIALVVRSYLRSMGVRSLSMTASNAWV